MTIATERRSREDGRQRRSRRARSRPGRGISGGMRLTSDGQRHATRPRAASGAAECGQHGLFRRCNWRISAARDAPSAVRTAISRARSIDRPSTSVPRFTAASSRIKPDRAEQDQQRRSHVAGDGSPAARRRGRHVPSPSSSSVRARMAGVSCCSSSCACFDRDARREPSQRERELRPVLRAAGDEGQGRPDVGARLAKLRSSRGITPMTS